MQRVMRDASGKHEELEITSFREGDVVGMHEMVLESPQIEFICAMMPSRAWALPMARCARRNGC